MIEKRTTKPWYKSKTVWLGILSVVAAVVTAFTPLAPLATSGILAGVGAINVWLRTMDTGN
jgi:uncharacterized membrane protein HdeD (DUF308 family)